jgi:hypothetical protein
VTGGDWAGVVLQRARAGRMQGGRRAEVQVVTAVPAKKAEPGLELGVDRGLVRKAGSKRGGVGGPMGASCRSRTLARSLSGVGGNGGSGAINRKESEAGGRGSRRAVAERVVAAAHGACGFGGRSRRNRPERAGERSRSASADRVVVAADWAWGRWFDRGRRNDPDGGYDVGNGTGRRRNVAAINRGGRGSSKQPWAKGEARQRSRWRNNQPYRGDPGVAAGRKGSRTESAAAGGGRWRSGAAVARR